MTFKECTNVSEVAAVVARVYALGDFGADTPIGRMEQQEAENPHMAQLIFEVSEILFVLKANIVCTEAVGTLVGDTLY